MTLTLIRLLPYPKNHVEAGDEPVAAAQDIASQQGGFFATTEETNFQGREQGPGNITRVKLLNSPQQPSALVEGTKTILRCLQHCKSFSSFLNRRNVIASRSSGCLRSPTNANNPAISLISAMLPKARW